MNIDMYNKNKWVLRIDSLGMCFWVILVVEVIDIWRESLISDRENEIWYRVVKYD